MAWGRTLGCQQLQQSLKFAQGFHQDSWGDGAFLDGFACVPVEAFNLICQHDTCLMGVVADDDFKGIAFLMAGHGTAEHQAAGAIIGGW